MKIIKYDGQSANRLFGEREELTSGVESLVKNIIEDVKLNGDVALKKYAAQFDGYTGGQLKVTPAEFDEAFASLSKSYIATLERSVENISRFHKRQLTEGFEINDGDRVVGQKVIPVARAGIYVPGGTASYPSTVLMNAIHAKIAGVREIIMVTPVRADGKIRAEVLAAARLCGVTAVYKVGGAQAIAALAYGTESIPKADKITGPGNAYVATAKKLVAGVACGIDMIAGPSEILIIADGGADADYVAADLLSQAEHDRLASALLITDSQSLALDTAKKLEQRLAKLARRDIASASIENNCKIIVTDNLEQAVKLSNEFAPEHLELCVKKPFDLLNEITSAGSVFLGYDTPEAVGDYIAGANHTLPTSGSARFSSPLGVNDFVKITQYVRYSAKALKDCADDIVAFANSEGLTAHEDSVTVRLKK